MRGRWDEKVAKCSFGIIMGGESAGRGLDKGTKDENECCFSDY